MSEEVKIRYIFGAGASANAIPTVTNFASALEQWEKSFGLYASKVYELEPKYDPRYLYTLRGWIKEVRNLTQSTFSIDTLAKMRWFQENKMEYNRIKSVISLVIHLSQFTNTVDERYDAFLASLLTKENGQFVFPENIQLLSWNYDFQFILSFEKCMDLTFDQMKIIEPNPLERVPIININGSAQTTNSSKLLANPKHLDFLKLSKEESAIHELRRELPNIIKQTSKTKHWGNIKFSWEKELDINQINQFKPDVTVIIGYSFPTFNREIDRLLLKDNNPSKVYIQCNYYDGENDRWIDGNKEVHTKLLGMQIHKDVLKPIETSTEFYIPFELYGDRSMLSWPMGFAPN